MLLTKDLKICLRLQKSKKVTLLFYMFASSECCLRKRLPLKPEAGTVEYRKGKSNLLISQHMFLLQEVLVWESRHQKD